MAHPDLEELLDCLLPAAQQLLEKNGTFYPFGATMSKRGKATLTAAYDGDEHPEYQTIIDMLTEGFKKDAASGKIRAAGICFDGRTIPPGQSKKTDSIIMGLERIGDTVTVYLPYKKGLLGKIKYGEILAGQRDAEFFVS